MTARVPVQAAAEADGAPRPVTFEVTHRTLMDSQEPYSTTPLWHLAIPLARLPSYLTTLLKTYANQPGTPVDSKWPSCGEAPTIAQLYRWKVSS